jgi:predicted nucleic acid-binding protein
MNFLNKKILSLPSGDLFISVMTRMEVLSKPDHTPETEQAAREFLGKLTVIPLSLEVERLAISIRREGTPRPKLPDAIVASTAVILGAQLATSDEKLSRLVWPGLVAVTV